MWMRFEPSPCLTPYANSGLLLWSHGHFLHNLSVLSHCSKCRSYRGLHILKSAQITYITSGGFPNIVTNSVFQISPVKWVKMYRLLSRCPMTTEDKSQRNDKARITGNKQRVTSNGLETSLDETCLDLVLDEKVVRQDIHAGRHWSFDRLDNKFLRIPFHSGNSPVDRAKSGISLHLATGGRGMPLGAIITGANANDGHMSGFVPAGLSECD